MKYQSNRSTKTNEKLLYSLLIMLEYRIAPNIEHIKGFFQDCVWYDVVSG
jgi:hypothetical protein